MKVLLVEDAQGMRKLVSTMLQGMGFTDIIEAKDGAEGWKRLTQYDVDLVLTVWNMPIMDGIELVEKIRQAPGYTALPILLYRPHHQGRCTTSPPSRNRHLRHQALHTPTAPHQNSDITRQTLAPEDS